MTDRIIRTRAVPQLAKVLHADPLLHRVFAARGVQAADELQTHLAKLLPVSSLAGVNEAVELLLTHVAGRVLIVGDFDVDGATGTALLVRALRGFGFAHVDYAVPDRFRYGYGLTPAIVDMIVNERDAATRPTLLVTVDNGISSHDGVERAHSYGIPVLITDHHLPGRQLPNAAVIVNPNLPGNGFASKALAGVGVAFYVMAALRHQLEQVGQLPAEAPKLQQLLDLVALGTVADMVPLDANNRILVAHGIERIRKGQCVPGILALLETGQREAAQVVARDLGFTIAPKLNAAGRLEDMAAGIACLLSDSMSEARSLAITLDGLNRERRLIEQQMQLEARAAVSSLAQRRALDPATSEARHAGVCLYDAAWHAGVIGLVASRVKDQLNRPVIAFAPAEEPGLLRGSARSIAGVHIRDLLERIALQAPELLPRFGGHAMAAGLTLPAARLDEFARKFEAEVTVQLAGAALDDVFWTDGQLSAEQLGLPTARRLRDAAVWGQAFPEPSFEGEFQIERQRVVGERHVKFWLRSADGARLDAIAFNQPDLAKETTPRQSLRAAYRLDINHYQGEERLQLLLEHLQL